MSLFSRLATVLLLALSVLSMSTGQAAPPPSAAPLKPSFGCISVPTFNPNSPAFLAGDTPSAAPEQADVNCFAWQNFVALNWPVDPAWPASPAQAGQPDRNATAQTWGTPQNPNSGNLTSTAWQTFKPVQDIFLPGGKAPTGWGVVPAAPSSCLKAKGPLLGGVRPTRVLRSISKIPLANRPLLRASLLGAAASDGFGPDLINQAAGGWLTDQQGNLVWYERSVNQAEFQYLLQPDKVAADALYTATGQSTVATNSNGQHPNGLTFPPGLPNSGSIQPWNQLGATEIKAAWRILTNQPQLWPRYLLSQAYLVDPDTGACQTAVLGLVGLHIIRNTTSFPNFYWSTFEHIDNAPQLSASYPDPYTHPFGYSFYNPNCTVNCTPNVTRIDSHGKPLYPKKQPVQVTRSFPIPVNTARLNLAMQAAISAQNPQSVFQYYQLVNVQWDQSPQPPITQPNQKTPLRTSSMTSDGPNTPVANTTLETYVQSKSCVVCHSNAAIAGGSGLASDFSFIFLDTKTSLGRLLREQQKKAAHGQ
jgi:hypothetical protein